MEDDQLDSNSTSDFEDEDYFPTIEPPEEDEDAPGVTTMEIPVLTPPADCPAPDVTYNGSLLSSGSKNWNGVEAVAFKAVREVEFEVRVGPFAGDNQKCKLSCVQGEWVGPVCRSSEGKTDMTLHCIPNCVIYIFSIYRCSLRNAAKKLRAEFAPSEHANHVQLPRIDGKKRVDTSTPFLKLTMDQNGYADCNWYRGKKFREYLLRKKRELGKNIDGRLSNRSSVFDKADENPPRRNLSLYSRINRGSRPWPYRVEYFSRGDALTSFQLWKKSN